MKRFYGYKHWTLEDPPRCFNVGKGLKNRPFQALHHTRNHKWHAIVKRYGLRVEVCVGPIEHFDACAWEIENIALMGTFSTNHSHDDSSDIGCNFTKGGEGRFGYTPTSEERHKIRVKKVGLRPSEETRKRMSIAARARPCNNKGKKYTVEQILQIRAKQRATILRKKSSL